MKLKSIIIILFLLLEYSCANDVAKTILIVDAPQDIVTLQKGFYKGTISPDGNSILFTDASNNGLSQYTLLPKGLTYFTKAIDAGLEAFYGPEGNVFCYTTHDYSGKIRTTSLFVQDAKTGVRTIVAEGIRNLKIIRTTSNDRIIFYADGVLNGYDLNNMQFMEGTVSEKGVFIDGDLNLAVFINGKSEILNPSGKGNYLWASMSPDQNKILYTLSGKGSYISDLTGKKITSLGKLNAPKWSADGKWVIGMDDEDDGSRITRSDIILVTADGKSRQNLTADQEMIALYPTISPDGKYIAFNDEKGMVYLMNIL